MALYALGLALLLYYVQYLRYSDLFWAVFGLGLMMALMDIFKQQKGGAGRRLFSGTLPVIFFYAIELILKIFGRYSLAKNSVFVLNKFLAMALFYLNGYFAAWLIISLYDLAWLVIFGCLYSFNFIPIIYKLARQKLTNPEVK